MLYMFLCSNQRHIADPKIHWHVNGDTHIFKKNQTQSIVRRFLQQSSQRKNNIVKNALFCVEINFLFRIITPVPHRCVKWIAYGMMYRYHFLPEHLSSEWKTSIKSVLDWGQKTNSKISESYLVFIVQHCSNGVFWIPGYSQRMHCCKRLFPFG